MAAIDKLQLVAPDYADLPTAQDYIDLAEEQVGLKVCNRELAVAYLAAHTIAMSERGSSGGAVTSESEGRLSRSYAQNEKSLLSSTGYGQEYLRLIRSCGVGSFTMRTFV